MGGKRRAKKLKRDRFVYPDGIPLLLVLLVAPLLLDDNAAMPGMPGAGLGTEATFFGGVRFLYFAVAAPGKTNDLRSFNRCMQLRKWIQETIPDEWGCRFVWQFHIIHCRIRNWVSSLLYLHHHRTRACINTNESLAPI